MKEYEFALPTSDWTCIRLGCYEDLTCHSLLLINEILNPCSSFAKFVFPLILYAG